MQKNIKEHAIIRIFTSRVKYSWKLNYSEKIKNYNMFGFKDILSLN